MNNVKRRGDIVYGKDIVKAVAEKLKMDERKIQHVFDFLFPYIRQCSKKDDLFNIGLGQIGRIYFSAFRMKKDLERRNKMNLVSRRQRDNYRAAKKKVENFEKLYEEEKEKADVTYLRTVHYKGRALYKWYYTKNMNFKELEESQNADQEIN